MYLKYAKPLLDLILSGLGLLFLIPILIPILIILSCIHAASPLFIQTRVGQHGKYFQVYKLKTIKDNGKSNAFLQFLRKSKIDELPQLLNILKGEMSLVGPRPDIPGYYDKLEGENRLILNLKPGLTGYASLKFANEEELLKQQNNPLFYNDTIIFPEKVKLNLDYYRKVSLGLDSKIIIKTLLLPFN